MNLKNIKYFFTKDGLILLFLYFRLNQIPRYSKVSISFSGLNFFVPDFKSFFFQLKEIFIDNLYKFETDNKKPLIYDCGANVGVSVAYFKKLYPGCKILAFEADPKIFYYLENNISKNKFTNVFLFNNAVWKKNGLIKFGSEGADAGSIYDKNNVSIVKAIRLSDLLKKEKHVDFLKMDIEGAEVDVLLDCDNHLKNVDKIFIEYHSFSKHRQLLGKLLTCLSDNGFRYYIKSESSKLMPFMDIGNSKIMDLQLEIFCYK